MTFREWRKSMGLTQKQAAEILDVGIATIERWDRAPQMTMMQIFATRWLSYVFQEDR